MTSYSVVAQDHPLKWGAIHARGAEVRSFLQGQLSCDVAAIDVGESREGLLLAPNGEVLTSVTCRAHPEGVDVVMRAESIELALTALRRFLLRTKCEMSAHFDVEGPYATVGSQVRAGDPGPAEFAHHLGAHSFGAKFVARHVSFSKGCFTGQELVGRLDARGGNVPFRLARLTGDDELRMDRVARSAGPQGERALQGLTTLVRAQNLEALALVHRTLVGDDIDVTIEEVRVELL